MFRSVEIVEGCTLLLSSGRRTVVKETAEWVAWFCVGDTFRKVEDLEI